MILFLPLFIFAYQGTIPPDLQKRLHIQHGKYVIAFFASWCHSCRYELPKLEKLYKKGIKIVGVDVDEDSTQAKEFQKSLHLHFPIINDPQGSIVGAFNPVGIPAIYIVHDGQIVASIIGAHEDIEAMIVAKMRRN